MLLCYLSVEKSRIHKLSIPLHLSLERIPSCLCESRKVPRATEDGFVSKAVKTSCLISFIWYTLESLGRNPNWLQFNKQFSLVSLAKWLSVLSWTKWLWVRVQLQSLKLQISRLIWARSSLTFRLTTESGFILTRVRDMTRKYSHS